MLSHRLGFSSSPERLEWSSRTWRVPSAPSPAPASDKDRWRGEHDAPPGQQPDHLRRWNGRAHHRDPQNGRLRDSIGGDSRESIAPTYSRTRRVLALRPDLARLRCWVCTDPIQAVTFSSQTGQLRSIWPLTFSRRSMRRGLARRRARVGARVALARPRPTGVPVFRVSWWLDMDVARLLRGCCPSTAPSGERLVDGWRYAGGAGGGRPERARFDLTKPPDLRTSTETPSGALSICWHERFFDARQQHRRRTAAAQGRAGW